MNTLKTDRQELIEIISKAYKNESLIQTTFDSLSFYAHKSPTEMLSIMYEPSLCIIVQGQKEVEFGKRLQSYDPSMFLLASVHTPAKVRITQASEDKPYMGFTLTFSMEEIFDVLKDLDSTQQKQKTRRAGLYFGELEAPLLNAVLRLFKTLDKPNDLNVLGPLFKKEILYWLMRGQGGDFMRAYVKEEQSTHKVVKAISMIKEQYNQALNVSSLAENVGMSESSLYASFKEITSMSPLQFQKNLRLQEARHLMTIQNMTVSDAAFKVGYESPSQFSREYSRMYGLSPSADIQKLQSQA